MKSNYSYIQKLKEQQSRKHSPEKKAGGKAMQFDIIADKPSKVIIQLDKYFDMDMDQQINQLNLNKKTPVKAREQQAEAQKKQTYTTVLEKNMKRSQ